MQMSMESLTRRGWLRGAAVSFGVSAGPMSGLLRLLAADTPKKLAKSVIVLWMNGGPSTIDLWDLKPGHKNGGPFREIATTVPGMRIGEHLPKLSQHGMDLALVRSMSTKEGDHDRATYFLRTGYAPVGAIRFPALGAVMAKELGSESNDLPNFVSIAPGRNTTSIGGGFLGPKYAPLGIGDSAEGNGLPSLDHLSVPDLLRSPDVSDASQRARLEMLTSLNRSFGRDRFSTVAESIDAATARAVKLMRPEAAAAFDLAGEPVKIREGYGRNIFGQGVLLARRLVERGVPFVEVTLDGWDTHQDNFARVRDLCGTLDAAFATLLADLKDRGLLDTTLVVCQGEFGRTPKINGQSGRDHWPASWAVALAGGGVKTGQVVGKTSEDGMAVEERPVTVPDFIATVAKAVGIDPMKQNLSNVGRPIRVADPVAKPIKELL